MSQKTTTEFFCDRCSCSLGVKKPREDVTVEAHAWGEFAMDFSRSWKHLCGDCRNLVYAFFGKVP